MKRSGLFENQQGFTDKITVKEQNFPKLSKAQQNHQVFLVTLFKLVWLMKSSCRGEGADYPIIKFETISKTEEKKPQNQNRVRDLKVWEVQHHVSTPNTGGAWVLLLSWYLWPMSIPFHTLDNTLNRNAQKGTWELGCQCHQPRINQVFEKIIFICSFTKQEQLANPTFWQC